MLDWDFYRFDALTRDQLYAILALRQEVFIVEQQSIYCDLDGLDQRAVHLLGMEGITLVAYLRILPKHLYKPNKVSFGRVIVAPSYRRQQLGRELVQRGLDYIKSIDSDVPILVSAQLHLKKFYVQFGFVAKGAPYMEDGIPHVRMYG